MSNVIERAKALAELLDGCDVEKIAKQLDAPDTIRELLTIIERLPVTADGVYVPASDGGEFVYFPGDPLPLRVCFSVDSGTWAVRNWGDLPEGEVRHYTSCCYATREAAEAAREASKQ